MLKIHQTFIVKFLLLIVGTLLLSSFISYISLKSIIKESYTSHLKNSINLMLININDFSDLDVFAKDVHDSTNLRVTIVSDSGKVLAESNADKKNMDNHKNRAEIKQADKSEFAELTRYSDTINTDFLYVAKKVKYRKKNIYIRLSMSLAQTMKEFSILWRELFFVFIGIVLISSYLIKNMSKKIVYDIAQITSYLDEIANKNYKAIIKTEHFYEFLHISLLLKNLVKKLNSSDKKKAKNMAKLRLINKQRDDLLSALSHEFKNPIASIIGYAQTIEDDEDMLLQTRKKFLKKIASNGEKMSKILDRLALSVKLDNGDLKIKKSEFDLKDLTKEVITNLNYKYKDREIILKAKKTKLNSDKDMLELVLVNLIDNALKYSQDKIEVHLADNTLRVIDRGIGIKEEHLDKITSKYYRVEKNSWDNSMGIGLAMVSYILKSLDSSLEIKSEFSKGSEFSFSVKKMTIS